MLSQLLEEVAVLDGLEPLILLRHVQRREIRAQLLDAGAIDFPRAFLPLVAVAGN